MSLESVQTIIGRAVCDREYRELLFSDPAAALAGYELTAEESATLQRLPHEQFDALAGEVEERISKAGFINATSLLACDGSSKEPASLMRPIFEAFFGLGLDGKG